MSCNMAFLYWGRTHIIYFMNILDYLDKIPGKIFPVLEPKERNGVLVFPHKFVREVFHIIGSCLLIGISYSLSIFVYSNTPFVVFIGLSIWITYQEFYLHPQKYNQKIGEGVLDWMSWIVPFSIFILIFY